MRETEKHLIHRIRPDFIHEDLIQPVSLKEKKEILQTQRAKSALMDNTLMKEVLEIKRIRMGRKVCLHGPETVLDLITVGADGKDAFCRIIQIVATA